MPMRRVMAHAVDLSSMPPRVWEVSSEGELGGMVRAGTPTWKRAVSQAKRMIRETGEPIKGKPTPIQRNTRR